MKLLVAASTFPAGESDPVPGFVRDQIIALKRITPSLEIHVLAPHDVRSGTRDCTHHDSYVEHRFHYFWPHSAEKLAGRGIMAALKANPLTYFLLPFLFIGEFAALLSLTRKLRPDLIYAHWFTPQAVVARWVSRIAGVPFMFTTHASDVEVWSRIPVLGRAIVRGTALRACAFTAVSRRSMDKLRRMLSEPDWARIESRGQIIPMGLNLPVGAPGATGTGKTTIFLFMGRLVEKKGVQYLLRAFAAARPLIPHSRLVIAGDGPMREQLEGEAKELGLDGAIQFTGYVTGSRKHDLLLQADVHVIPSIIAADGDAEGLPVSLMEGLAYGKICIATPESGADHVLADGRDGYIVPQKDPHALSAAMVRAARLDGETRFQIQQSARKAAQGFDWQVIGGKYHELLIGALRRAR